ncbi:MAG: TonB-dependent receptor domain-containing protein [Acidobacteriaceae bacterium]
MRSLLKLFPDVIVIGVFAGMLCLLPSAAKAQTITGNIAGRITDASGAVVPNAKVVAKNVANGYVFNTVTGVSGAYSLRFLPIGDYTVTVSAKGFATQSFGPFSLEIDQTAKVNAALKVSTASTTVTVSTHYVPLLNTEDSTIATTIDNNTIQNIPLNGRNFSSLTIFLPGSVETAPAGMIGANGTERDTNQAGQTSIDGQRNQTNNYYLDGIEINETINNVIGYNPSPDALTQMQVISANAPAEYGNVNGGDVLMVLKSGTNNFHGSAFYFVENWHLDANTWTNKHSIPIVPRVHYTQPMFGGTIGGPIFKDKLFFFADYEGFRHPNNGVGLASVATAAMRQGDFSALLSYGKGTQLYNNSNDATTGPVPYVNNQVPITNPAAAYLFSHPNIYPLPNATPIDGLIENNYEGPTRGFTRNDQGDVKVDWKPNEKDTLSVRYLQGEASNGTTLAVLPITFPGLDDYPTKGIAINDVHVFSNSIVNEFRAGFTRVRWIQGAPIDTTGVFGLKGDSVLGIDAAQPYVGFTGLDFTCSSTPGCSSVSLPSNLGNSVTATQITDNTFEYGDDLTWLKGNHSFKMGAQFLRYQQNNYYPGNSGADGYFDYYPWATENLSTGEAGYPVADFALNDASQIGQGGLNENGQLTGDNGQRQWRDAYYFQDDWKFRPNLTFNLGIRYEYDQPIYEVNNKEANIDFATKSVVYAGVDGHSRALYPAVYTNVMPRVGFNYQPMNKLVIRGGYGDTAYLEGTGANLRLVYNPPFWNEKIGTTPTPNKTTDGPFFPVQNGFASGSSPTLAGSTFRAWHKVVPSIVSEWNLGVQYALAPKTSINVTYLGEYGEHLIQAIAYNQLVKPCIVNGVIDTSTTSAACAAADPAPFINIVGQNGSVVGTTSEAMMDYNALQVTVRQRPIEGLEFTVNYTYGHSFTDSSGFFGVADVNSASPYAEDAYNNHAEYGPSGMDIRNNVNGTAVYTVPFGHGLRFGSNANRVVDGVLGGWKAAVSAVAYTGFPETVNGVDNSATGARAARPNQYRKLKIVHRSVNHWFGTDPSEKSCTENGVDNGVCAFGNTALGTFGNAQVNSVRAPGFQQYDFSVYKQFPTWAHEMLTLRADIFNAFNISSYGNPDNGYADQDFGEITTVRSVPRQIQFSANYSF